MRTRARRPWTPSWAAGLWLWWLLQACAPPAQGSLGAPADAVADTAAPDTTAADTAVPDASAVDAAAGDTAAAPLDSQPLDATADVAAAGDGGLGDLGPSDAAPQDLGGGDTAPGGDAAAADTADGQANADTAGDAGAAPWSLAQAQAALNSGSAAQLKALLAAYDMPICASGTCLFLVLQPTAKSVAVVGDWGGWSQPAPLQPLPAAPGWHAGNIALDHTVVREYKLQLDGAWALDPSNPYFRFGGFGPNSAIYPPGHSRLRRFAAVASPQLGNSRDLFVQLPAAYFSNPNQHFAVVYWHDGFNVFSNPKAPFGDWGLDKTADQLIAQGALAPFIQVGIDTDDRMSEYVWGALQVGTKSYPPKISAYAKFLVETVKPLIDKSLRTLPDRDHTALGGSSLGGNASLWIGWHHWPVFGRIASFSGALWVGEGSEEGSTAQGPTMRQLIASNPAAVPKGALRIYLDSGDRDFDDVACYACDAWGYSDWTRNALIAAGWDNRAAWDSDGDLATAPADLPLSTPVAKVKALAWAPQPPAGQSWASWLGLQNNLLSLVGHGHQHSEPAWQQRSAAALRYVLHGW